MKVEAAHRLDVPPFQLLLTSRERHSKVQPIIFGVRDRPSLYSWFVVLTAFVIIFFSFFLFRFCFFFLSPFSYRVNFFLVARARTCPAIFNGLHVHWLFTWAISLKDQNEKKIRNQRQNNNIHDAKRKKRKIIKIYIIHKYDRTRFKFVKTWRYAHTKISICY